MTHIPSYIERQVTERGDFADELLLALVKAVEDQNAILEDTIHSELKRIADSQESIAVCLDEIVKHYGS